MAVSGYGAAADHAALSGLPNGDPHTQYAVSLQGLLADRPLPVAYRKGTRFFAVDEGREYLLVELTPGVPSWALTDPPVDLSPATARIDVLEAAASRGRLYRTFLFGQGG